jgi:hypothetical protein
MNKILAWTLPLMAVGGVWYAVSKKKALDDLSVDLAAIKFDPVKDIKLKGTDIAAVLAVGNPRGSSLAVDIVDLRVKIDGNDIGRIVDYKLKARADAKSLSSITVKGTVPTLGVIKVLGRTVINMITDLKAGKGTKEAIYAALPKMARVVGKVRAEGQVFEIDEEVQLVQKESEIKKDKDGKVIKEPK